MPRSVTMAAAVVAAVAVSAPANAADELKIGFITTLTGGAAFLGKAQLNGFKLGLEHEGWTKDGDKLGGVPMKLIVGDDQVRPAVGLDVARKMLESDNVDIIAGIIWSNVLLSVQRQVLAAKKILISTNAGAAPMAGRRCNPLFLNVSFQNDEGSEALGLLMNKEGIKTVYAMAPNYQAGKDNIAGFKKTFKGKIVGQTLFKINQTDYQAELARVRAAKPEAVFTFAPGGMGIALMKQWAASGLGKEIKLYTMYVVDNGTLPAIGKAAVGTFHTQFWGADMDTPRNKKFVKDWVAKYKALPSMFAPAAYDGARLIADGLRATKGNFKDTLALAKAMRKNGLNSVRGQLKFNVNGFLIQPYYKREVIMVNDTPTIRTLEVVRTDKDSYWQRCPKANRL